jgi:hypothetical protein
MFVGNRVAMDTTTLSPRDEQSTQTDRHVRVDLAIGLGLLTVAIAGKLIWEASDLGLFAVLGLR